jgi:hypothetical protein
MIETGGAGSRVYETSLAVIDTMKATKSQPKRKGQGVVVDPQTVCSKAVMATRDRAGVQTSKVVRAGVSGYNMHR